MLASSSHNLIRSETRSAINRIIFRSKFTSLTCRGYHPRGGRVGELPLPPTGASCCQALHSFLHAEGQSCNSTKGDSFIALSKRLRSNPRARRPPLVVKATSNKGSNDHSSWMQSYRVLEICASHWKRHPVNGIRARSSPGGFLKGTLLHAAVFASPIFSCPQSSVSLPSFP